MTAETRKLERKSGVFFESIRSRCSHTQSTLEGGQGTSLRGSLRVFLDCLAREIERLSSSSTTFNMRFSWRLSRGLYPYVVRGCQSSSSTECVELELPMKVLDDLAVCRVRARLRSQAVMQTGATLAEMRGKRTWAELRGIMRNMAVSSLEKTGACVLASFVEKDVVLTAIHVDDARIWSILLRGRIDLALLVHMKNHLFTMLFEVTEYREAPRVVVHRLQTYASALYGELGFPVIPVLIIVGEQAIVDVLVMYNTEYVPGYELKKAIGKLVKAISTSEEAKPTSSEVCAVCDPSTKRLCPYAH